MQDTAQYMLDEASADGTRLVLSGQLTLASIGPLDRELARLSGTIRTVDLAAVDEIDTVGA